MTAALPLQPPARHLEALPPHLEPTPGPRIAMESLFEGRGWIVLCASVDFAMASVAVLLALRGVRVLQSSSQRSAMLALPVFVVPLLFLHGAYRRRLRVLALDWLPLLVGAVSAATTAVAMLALLINGRVTDPSAWVYVWLLALVMVVSGRLTLALAHRQARSRRRSARTVLIVGAGRVGTRLARRLEAHPEYGMVPVGFLDDDPRSTAEVGKRGAPVLGPVDAIESVLSSTGVRSLIVAFSSASDARVSGVVRLCQELGVEVSVVPRLFEIINNRVSYETLGGLPLLSFRFVDRAGWQFAVKHALDRLLAAVLLILLAPLMTAIALAVRLTSPGPILFRQRRVGRDGKVFDLYKFRSMRWRQPETTSRSDEHLAGQPGTTSRSDEYLAAWLVRKDVGPGGVEGDKRLTTIGGLLRKLSLDELPQLINVLKGDMSIIGPRPERPEFVELFARDIAGYHERHRVKSGITGWAQVHGLRGPTSLTDRTEWDNYYIAHWSLGLDLKILVLTVLALFRGR